MLTVTATAALRELTSQPSDPISVTVADKTAPALGSLGSLGLYFGSFGG